jgi:lipoate-protein ligase A
MNKKEIVKKYNESVGEIFKNLEELKELMRREDFKKMMEEKDSYSDEEYEEVECIYEDFGVLVNDLFSEYK